jgi:phenylacetate-CoA oxygenase PaaH subunit
MQTPTSPDAEEIGSWRGQGTIFEVFRQERRGKPLEHAGSFRAPDERAAEVYAREFYGRRHESEAIWLVPRSAVRAIEDVPEEFDQSYRRVDGYSLKVRLREARERAGTLGAGPGGGAE